MERRSVACVAVTVSKMSPRFVSLSSQEKAFLPEHDVEFLCMISEVWWVAKYISERGGVPGEGGVPGGQEKKCLKKCDNFCEQVFTAKVFAKMFCSPYHINHHSVQDPFRLPMCMAAYRDRCRRIMFTCWEKVEKSWKKSWEKVETKWVAHRNY